MKQAYTTPHETSNSSRTGRRDARRFLASSGGRRQRLQLEFLGRRRWQFLDVAQEGDELPDLGVVQRFVPGGHAGPADAMLDDVVVLVLGHVWGVFEKDRHRRIKRTGEDAA